MRTLIALTFLEGVFISVFSIFIVFSILAILMVSLQLLKYLKIKEKSEIVKTIAKKSFTFADVEDEDMMVAALVSSIEYRSEFKTDFFIKSIKRIT